MEKASIFSDRGTSRHFPITPVPAVHGTTDLNPSTLFTAEEYTAISPTPSSLTPSRATPASIIPHSLHSPPPPRPAKQNGQSKRVFLRGPGSNWLMALRAEWCWREAWSSLKSYLECEGNKSSPQPNTRQSKNVSLRRISERCTQNSALRTRRRARVCLCAYVWNTSVYCEYQHLESPTSWKCLKVPDKSHTVLRRETIKLRKKN